MTSMLLEFCGCAHLQESFVSNMVLFSYARLPALLKDTGRNCHSQ